MRRLILASGSPARRSLLESAGLRPEVLVSHVDEDGVDDLTAADAVAVLARRKGEAVAGRPEAADAIIVACDSMLELEGEAWSKPDSADEVVRRWKRMRGATGRLHTGHFLIDTATESHAAATDTAIVHFGDPTDAEIAAYAATEESRQVAGPFTLEGRSSAWVDSIEGNPGTILGISLPVLRRLLDRLGVELISLWP